MLQRCTARDKFALTSRRIDGDGYLVARVALARTGIQEYTAKELGLDTKLGLDGAKILRLHRPAEEVFAADSMATAERKPITNDHPGGFVNSTNWRQVAVGDVHGIAKDGEVLGGDVIIRHADAVKAVQGGKDQLSLGYDFDLEHTAGTTADGKAFDGTMRKININHLAIVDFARCGATCRVGDCDHTRTKDKTMRTITVDGVSIKLEDDTAASLVEKVVGDSTKAVKLATDGQTSAEAKLATADKALADEKAATVKLVADHAKALEDSKKLQTTPEQVEALATERAAVVADAALLVEDFKGEGKTIAAIRSEVIAAVIAGDEALKPVANAVLGGVALDKAEPADVAKAFAAVVASHKAQAGDQRVSTGDAADVGRAVSGNNTPKGPILTGYALTLANLQKSKSASAS